jgi:hypothetical protein
MILLDVLSDAHFNGVSTEIVFGSIFKGNVFGGLIGNSAQVLDMISRLTWKPLRTYLNISYVNLQSGLKGAIRDCKLKTKLRIKKTTTKTYYTLIVKHSSKLLITKNKFLFKYVKASIKQPHV